MASLQSVMTQNCSTVRHFDMQQQQQPNQDGEERTQQEKRKPLNFLKAMNDFETMFPEIDRDVIETVLRANNGVVQPTIDQLLVLQESAASEKINSSNSSLVLPSYEESSLQASNEPPPAYADIWRDDTNPPTTSIITPPSDFSNCKWRPPLVGRLPDDFLKLENASGVCSVSKENADDSTTPEDEADQFMEDEKLAVYLQNEEFLRELRRNKEFVHSLEADHKRAGVSSGVQVQSTGAVASGGARSKTTPGQEDVAFKLKLKHMGKSTKKKFGKMARRFSKKGSHKQATIFSSESTFNLLEEDEDRQVSGLDGVQEDNCEDEAMDLSSLSATGRQLPQTPSNISSNKNDEPIVFYSEDNEFQLKNDI